MLDISKIIAPIEKLIIEHGSATVRQDIINLVKEQLSIASKKIAELEQTNSDLHQEIANLKEDLARVTIPKDFIEYRDVLFRCVDGDVALETVYCLDCKVAMTSFHNEFPFKCSKCGRQANFIGRELPKIAAEAVHVAKR